MKRVTLSADAVALEAYMMRSIPKVVTKRLGRTIANRLGKRTARVMDAHYKHAISEVRTPVAVGHLALGVYNGTRRLSYHDMDDSARSLSVNWPKLSKKYLLRKPKSFSFWHKTGKLGKEYTAATAWARSKVSSVKSVGARVSVGSSGRLPKLELHWTLQFSPMPGVLRGLVTQTFVTAQEGVLAQDTVGTDPLDRILYPETGTKHAPPRPYIRAMSARLGANAHVAVKHDADRWRALLKS